MATVTNSKTYPRFLDRLHALWQRIAHRNTKPIALADSSPLELPADMSGLLAQAVQESSNHELDWLWYAMQAQSEAERQYCVGRARHINPHSEIVRASRTWF